MSEIKQSIVDAFYRLENLADVRQQCIVRMTLLYLLQKPNLPAGDYLDAILKAWQIYRGDLVTSEEPITSLALEVMRQNHRFYDHVKNGGVLHTMFTYN